MKTQPRRAVTLAEVAEHGLGLRAADLPRGDEELRAVVIGEAVRLAVCEQYARNGGMPVSHAETRNWVGRKLEAAIPDVFESEDTIDYRDVLVEASGSNMEQLGDVLVLSGGMLCPAPTRVIHAGGNDHILTSGLPTARLHPVLQRHVKFNMTGRRLVGITESDLSRTGTRKRTVETFLNAKRHASTPDQLLQNVLRQDPDEWHRDDRWECYQGYDRTRFDMQFKANEHSIPAGGGSSLQLWRRPSGRTSHEYWLRDLSQPRKVYRVDATEWIRTCLALDYLTGDPRRAFLTEENGDGRVRLTFNPWGLFWRWLLLQGAVPQPRSGPYRSWRISANGLEQGAAFLEKVGVHVENR